MSSDDERSENMGRPKGSASIYDEGPRSARCETCGFCAVSEAVKRNLTPVQVSERTGLRIEACRHIFRRLGVPYGN